MRIILKGAVFLLSLILCFIIIARIAAAPAKEKPVEDTYNDASSTGFYIPYRNCAGTFAA
jgi:hypothetical protein